MSLVAEAAGAAGLQILGWTLVHAVWQAAAVALLLAVLLRATRGAAARVRYSLSCTALGVAVALALATASGMAGRWSEHRGCWELAEAGVAPPIGACGGHGVVQEEHREHYRRAEAVVRVDPLYARALVLTPALGAAAVLWLAVSSLLLLRLGIAWLRVRRLRRRDATPLDGPLAEALPGLRERLGIDAPVALLRSGAVAVPTVIGWRRPAVLFPAAVLEALPTRELEAVLAHELAHVRRHDFAVNLAQSVAEALLWFHPAVRWISRRIREERELCCDELALVTLPGRLPTYLRALLAIDTMRLGASPRHALAISGGPLLQRARRLAEPRPPERGRRARLALLVAGGVLLWLPAVQIDAAARLSAWSVMTLDLRQRGAVAARNVAPRPAGTVPTREPVRGPR